MTEAELFASLTSAPATRVHQAWMFDTFTRSLCDSMGDGYDARMDRDALGRAMRDPAATSLVVTPGSSADDFVGWAVGIGGAVVFAYVRYCHRRMGIGSNLMAMVTDSLPPWRFCYWTRAISRMSVKGFPCLHDMDAHDELILKVKGNHAQESHVHPFQKQHQYPAAGV
jgi:hypothetical protein